MSTQSEARERQAERELGETRVARPTAALLVGAFLATLAVVPLRDQLAAPPAWGELFAQAPTECSLEAFERALEDGSTVADALRPPVQAWLLRTLGLGNEQVYPGGGGWLFHRPGVDYATGRGFLEPEVLRARVVGADPCEPIPEPDPRGAIVDFDAQLRARGVRLLVVPTPVKAVVAPARLARRRAEAPAHNPSFAAFVASLERDGVAVLDPTPLLLGEGDYLATDTHWRPEAMERVAAAVARRLEALVALEPGAPLARGSAEARNRGDLTGMLGLPEGQTLYPPERVGLRPVPSPAGPPAVLLLGDSFSNIYSSREAFAQRVAGEALDWGGDAGLADQLAAALSLPVARIVRNAGGAHATRLALARELADAARDGRDGLAGVRAVVWQFAVRELASGDWRRVALPGPQGRPVGAPEEGAPAAAGPADEGPAEAAALVIEGVVAARAEPPRPDTVPYPHALVAVHLTSVRGLPDADEVLVYVFGMRDHRWTDAARWRPGRRVRLRLTPWEDPTVQKELATLSRAELDDLELLALPAYFAEEGGE